MKKVKVRLKRVHYANGIRKVPGNVIAVDSVTAKWLEKQKVGRIENFPR